MIENKKDRDEVDRKSSSKSKLDVRKKKKKTKTLGLMRKLDVEHPTASPKLKRRKLVETFSFK